jgi:hypothetical protein
MRKCADCNYASDDNICLHESAQDPGGGPNLTTSANRSITDTRHCGREGRFWQPRKLVYPPAPSVE